MGIQGVTERDRRRFMRSCPALLATCIVAGIVAGIPVVPGAPAVPAAHAATSTGGRLCSGLQATGAFSSPSDTATYKLFVPNGATVEVIGALDILAKNTTGGWQTIFHVSPFDFWLRGPGHRVPPGPHYDLGFTSEFWRNDGPSHDIVVTVSQQFGTRVNWRFTATVSGGGGTGPCTPIAPTEVLGSNCAERHVTNAQILVADPVNVATGNFHESFTDFAIPGRGPGLAMDHSYNSLQAAADGPLGFGWTHAYAMSVAVDPVSGVATVTQEGGATVPFWPDGAGTFEAPPRAVATLVRNGDGSFTFGRCNDTTMTFSPNGQLTSIADRNGYATTLHYVDGRLSTVTDAADRKLHVGWTGSHVTSVTDSSTPARSVGFVYDGAGDMSHYTDVGGSQWRFTYEPGTHRLLTMRRPRQASLPGTPVTTNTYDGSGRVLTQTDELGRQTTLDYTSIPNSTKVTDPKGNVMVAAFKDYLPVSVTLGYGTPGAATHSFEADVTGAMAKVTDANGHTTRYTYDPHGNLTSARDAKNHLTSATYNTFDEPLTVTDANGVTTTNTYDARGNLESVSTPLVGTAAVRRTTFAYDPAKPGDLVTVTDPRGEVWTQTHDSFGNLATSTDPLGNKTAYGYDAATGWLKSAVSPRGSAAGIAPGCTPPALGCARFEHDAWGKVTVATDANAHRSIRHYDANGNVDHAIDANDNKTVFGFDAADQPVSTERADATVVGTEYWPDATIKATVDGAGRATTFDYDPKGRMTSMTDPNGRATAYGYDPAGRVVSKADHGGACPGTGCTTMAYDEVGQLTSVTHGDGTTPNVGPITFDRVGRRTAMTDGSGTSTWKWDSLGRITEATNGAGQRLGYAYANLRDPATTVTYPGNRSVTRGFDAAGRMTTVGDWLSNTTTFVPDADSNVARVEFPAATGLVDSATFDDADRLMTITDKAGSTTTASFTYGRDNADQVKSATTTGLVDNHTYDYTPLNQLKNLDAASYSHDDADNLTGLASGATIAYDDANQATSVARPTGTTAMGYDDRGNRTSADPSAGAGTNLSYDQANRLTSVDPTSFPSSVAAGGSHSLAAKADGTVWAWGGNSQGQLGNDSTTHARVPVAVAGLTGVVAVAAGADHSLALKADGTVWAWGQNANGQLGNDSTVASRVPVQVTALSGVTAIAAGAAHSLALRSDGVVWAWGQNLKGQLGNNSVTDSRVPVAVRGLSGIVSMSGGYHHSVAVRADGTVWAWGANNLGQLGNTSPTNARVPVQVAGLTGVASVAAGFFHTIALRADGTVMAWGWNRYGQLGNNSTVDTRVPVQVTALSGVTSVAAGGHQSYALHGGGATSAWGLNNAGQLGDNSTTDARVPVASGLSGATGLAAGTGHVVALRADDTLVAWGTNAVGALGDGTTVDARSPVNVATPAPANFSATVAGGWFHSLAVKADGTVWAWGANAKGQLGNNTTTDSSVPVQVSGLTGVVAVAAGAFHSMALKADGTVWTWGYNATGQLGNNSTVDSRVPARVVGVSGISAIAAGASHNLAMRDGNVWAWGSNSNGQIGNNATTDAKVPVRLTTLTGVVSLAGGHSHSVAARSDGTVRAWGHNGYGQLGNNSSVDARVPVAVSGLTGVRSVSAGIFHTMALKTDGAVWTWGYNGFGQLGNNTTTNTSVPVQVPGLGGVATLAGGGYQSYVLKGDGTAWAWGWNSGGQLGNNSTADAWVPVAVGLANLTGLAAGTSHVLAVRANTTVAAWGYNPYGAVGNGTTAPASSPVSVSGFARGGPTFSRGDAPRATYAYDGDGLRASKTVAGVTTAFTWEASSGLPLLVDDGTNSYVYGPDNLPVAHIDRANNVTWYHHDQLGSTRTLSSSTGATVATATYDPYGNLTASTGKLSPLGFAGEYTDAETGLVYLRARYYDPPTGQFLTRDPLGPAAGHPYAYVGGNPLNYTDPSGLFRIPGTSICVDIADPNCRSVVEQHAGGAQRVANFSAGVFNGIFLGHGRGILDNFGPTKGKADYCSGEYGVGTTVGITMDFLAVAVAFGRGGLPQRTTSLGSTGRTVPGTLHEKLAMEQAMSNPGAGTRLSVTMTDARWRAADGWVKMSQNVNGTEIHEVRNTITGAVDDFKFIGGPG